MALCLQRLSFESEADVIEPQRSSSALAVEVEEEELFREVLIF